VARLTLRIRPHYLKVHSAGHQQKRVPGHFPPHNRILIIMHRIASSRFYADSGERYYCLDCGATGDVDDTGATLVMLPQPTHKPMPAMVSAELPEVA
jgi:hypothetical protein